MNEHTMRTQLGSPKRTKMVCTLGPASQSQAMIANLIDAGMNVARLNCSHGDQQTRATIFNNIRTVADSMNRSVAIMVDLSGPKIRVNQIEGGGVDLEVGTAVTFVRGSQPGTRQALTTTYENFIDDVNEGELIFLDDGRIRLLATKKDKDSLKCSVELGGRLTSKKGINLPGTIISAPSMTEKDRDDMRHGVELGADFFALSFVRHPNDIRDLRLELEQLDSKAQIIAKIEKPQALRHLDQIIEESDAVMVARGDLGIELPVEKVPAYQKRIILQCRRAFTPVIVATQMLESMIQNPTPTRAEVSDIANAVDDGCDAVMLSAETATGSYPVEAAVTMANVARDAEQDRIDRMYEIDFARDSGGDPLRKAMVLGAVQIAGPLGAKFIVVRSETGETARYLSELRSSFPVIAVHLDDAVLRRHALMWGVLPVQTDGGHSDIVMQPDMETELHYLARALLQQKLARTTDHVVVVSRYPWGEQLPPNTIRAMRIDEAIGDDWTGPVSLRKRKVE